MTTPIELGPDLGPTADEMTRVVAGISDAMLTNRTPCTESTVGDLLDHCLGLSVAFTAGARKESLPGNDAPPPVPSASHLPPDWREQLPARLTALAEVWRDPAARVGMTRVGGVTMPGEVMHLVALDEVFLHGWDLAVSTGQDYRPDEAALQVVHGFLVESTRDNPGGTPGLFGPVVPVPEVAPLLERALGLSGRRSDWRP